MARKSTTRPKIGTVVVGLNHFWREDENRPLYRGNIRIGDKDYDLSLWVDAFVPGAGTPLALSGEVSEKKNG